MAPLTAHPNLLLLLLASIPLSLHSCIWIDAAPIVVPDLSLCQPAIGTSPGFPGEEQVLDCCLPPTNQDNIKEFSFKDYPIRQKKIRRAAHKASAKYIEKYNRAYQLMRALPSDDPRSFAVQANIHCAFCNGAYKQRDTNITLQVHFSWLFLPWHRWYIYFHERILGSLLGDPSFALLYWNWDNQVDGGNSLPPLFAVNGSALYDRNRDANANLGLNASAAPLVRLRIGSAATLSPSEVIQENLNVMYQSMVTASTADMFMGGAYSAGTDFSNVSADNAPLGGTLELNAHGGIHYWTGDPRATLRGDMGVFTTAARDPIFYAHHTNVDRLWEVWKSIPGGRRTNPIDKDFLDAEFLFFDENSNLVKVKVRDALDYEKLGIEYKKAHKGDNQWLNFEPLPVSQGSQVEYARMQGAKEMVPFDKQSLDSPKYELGLNFTALVQRPQSEKGDDEEEVLCIQGLEVTQDTFVHLQVFLNLPQANASTPIVSAEYLGSTNLVPMPAHSKHLTTNVILEIGDNIKRIGLQKDEWVVITILVQTDDPMSASSITIRGMSIQYH
ncbi:hypothetical protein GOP47_0008603 [Adiantum capillus-veneris]|uniref:Tyrosinase copper-binding domain-containing protein n=1 Tax=Adiantum capillus-veneris TaxID=13818 RepID=A0A9D4ZI76_ADICA|nr:hypothetical protein GOP47_0008603 [Adiantum capillus-veneris]